MRQLSPEERRRWQSMTLASPRRRYGADARLLFRLEDLVFGPAGTLPRFRARELIARTPYQSWEQAAYLKADQRGNGRSRQIGCDEGVHKKISLARFIIPAARA
jgi:hypothetical protein